MNAKAPCNCSSQNKAMANRDNMRRLASKAARMEQRIYVIIRKHDDTYTFEPIDAIGTKGDIIEYVHYL
jgi:hypothetical protein